MDVPEALFVQTAHYNFILHIYKENESMFFYIGDDIDKYFNIRVPLNHHYAYVDADNAIYDSAYISIANDYKNNYDFASELLEALNFILRAKFPQIMHVQITDNSRYGCGRPHSTHNLELITYSTALFAKNWYEMRLNASIQENGYKYNNYNSIPYQTPEEYRQQVTYYASKENKELWSFEEIACIAQKWNVYMGTEGDFGKHRDVIKQMYESTETFPEFFGLLNTLVERQYRGSYYRTWLSIFMQENIEYHNTWLYDVSPKNSNTQLIVSSMPSKPLNSFKLESRTEHYHFLVDVLEFEERFNLLVEHENRSCLRVIIERPNMHNSHIAVLDKIEAIKDCSYDKINDDYLEKYSFGLELLQFVNFILKRQFTYVKKVELEDQSKIVCSRGVPRDDTLDLKTYNIAMHKKTWYEMHLGAYLKLDLDAMIYKKGIELYGNESYKKASKFNEFYRTVVSKMGKDSFAKAYFKENKENIQKLYENAQTFPIFFKQLGAMVSRKDKCKLFNPWLEHFIKSEVRFHGKWIYDLDKISVGGTRRVRRRAPKTRKASK